MKAVVLLMICLASAISTAHKLDGDHFHDHSHDQDDHHHADHRDDDHNVFPVAEEYSTEGPPKPYSFTYKAGRYPNHVDRVHSESRGEDGVVQGSYEYLDPLRRLVRVDYTVDENGYQPVVQGPVPQQPKESAAVLRERERHVAISQRIAAQQAQIAAYHAQLRQQQEEKLRQEDEALYQNQERFSIDD